VHCATCKEQTTPHVLSLAAAIVQHHPTCSCLPKTLFSFRVLSTIIQLTMSSMSSFRGGYTPRRGRGGWNKPFTKPRKDVAKPDTDKNPLGELLKSISNSDLKLDGYSVHSKEPISDLRYIASYNWRSDSSATIIVPGMEESKCHSIAADIPKANLHSGRPSRMRNA
jgi:hypothetical protein